MKRSACSAWLACFFLTGNKSVTGVRGAARHGEVYLQPSLSNYFERCISPDCSFSKTSLSC